MYRQYLKHLGLDANASKADIKAAFKKLALQVHPDKNNNATTSTEEFQKVKEAYDFLMNHDPPNMSCDDGNGDGSDNPLDTAWAKMVDILLSHVTEAMKRTKEMKREEKRSEKKERRRHKSRPSTSDEEESQVNQHPKPPPLDITMSVTLDELYHAKVKKLLIKIKGPNNGELQQEELYVSLFAYKPTYTFKNKGDYVPNSKTTRGDINVHLRIEPHDLVQPDRILNPYDLYIEMDITLAEYYSRRYLALPYFDGLIEVTDLEPGKKCSVLKHKGLPFYNQERDEDTRGDLYIYYNLTLPRFKDDIVPPDVKEVLSKHFVWKE